jgi:hypothetical protein
MPQLGVSTLEEVTSNHIRRFILDKGKHPKVLFSYLFTKEEPMSALTYEWSLTFAEIFTFLNDKQLAATCKRWSLQECLSSQTRIWIDILFIDQVFVILSCSSFITHITTSIQYISAFITIFTTLRFFSVY